jgi:hypothetical protein
LGGESCLTTIPHSVEFSGEGRQDPVLAGVIEAWNGLPKGCVPPTGLVRFTREFRGVLAA